MEDVEPLNEGSRSVFVSYRHADEPEFARKIGRELQRRLGNDRVFIDIDNMTQGADFRRQSLAEVSHAHSLIVVIGARWLDTPYTTGPKAGTRRLDDPDDLVRKEIRTALERDLFVYPVLVDTSRPAQEDLPSDLIPLLYRIDETRTRDDDVSSLVDSVQASLQWRTLHEAFDDPTATTATISLKSSLGAKIDDFELSVYQKFESFCDGIYHRVDAAYPAGVKFPEYAYGRDWWLENGGRRLYHARERLNPTFGSRVEDTRPVIQMGVQPGDSVDFVLNPRMPRPEETERLKTWTIQIPRHGTNIERAARAIVRADALLITAGAGMGVDSGLPDFRGSEGFWRSFPKFRELGVNFEEAANPKWFHDNPELAWAFYGHRLNCYRDTEPHEGFKILRQWANRKEFGSFVFTSNVDGQFQQAGFQWESIVECHGSIHHTQCLERCCETIFSAKDLDVQVDPVAFRAQPPLPSCENCGGLLRPNIWMFNDDTWLSDRYDAQNQRYMQWLDDCRGIDLVVIECGAGKAVSTVRRESELRAGTLIRINPRDADVPRGQLSIELGALQAITEIDQLISDRWI